MRESEASSEKPYRQKRENGDRCKQVSLTGQNSPSRAFVCDMHDIQKIVDDRNRLVLAAEVVRRVSVGPGDVFYDRVFRELV